MRSTVRIDDDLIEVLRTRCEEEGLSMTRMLNRCCGPVWPRRRRPPAGRGFDRQPRAWAEPRVDLDKALSLAAALEDEEIVRKLAVRK